MNLSSELLIEIGILVQQVRTETMDQQELALRTGLSRSTISAIERGKAVNAKALFDVMAFLGLLEEIMLVVANKNRLFTQNRARKARNPKELPNDF